MGIEYQIFNISKDDNKESNKDLKKWIVDLSGEKAEIRLHGGDGETRGQVLIACSDDTFMALSTKKISPEMAYMRGLIQVKGNVSAISKVKELLSFTSTVSKPI